MTRYKPELPDETAYTTDNGSVVITPRADSTEWVKSTASVSLEDWR